MRIVVLNWRDLAHPGAGGSEVYVEEMARAWVARGHHVTFFSAEVPDRPLMETCEGVVHVRGGSQYTVYGQAKDFVLARPRGEVDLIVDVINTRPFMAPTFARGTPVVALIYQLAAEVWRHEVPLPAAIVGRYVLEPSWLRPYRDVPVATISASTHADVRALGFRDVHVVGVGLRLPALPPAPPREAAPTVAFLGRLARNKRPDHVLSAFALARRQLPGLRLWVIGDGVLRPDLERSAPPGVRFLGRVGELEKFDLLARAHVLVATSVREGWGINVSEAAAVGTPAVAYDVPGLRDSVSASGGVLVAERPAALAVELVERFTAGSLPVPGGPGTATWEEVADRFLDVVAVAR
ncbi:MAG TPA: glycosyltransferase family 4 protein [Acidimicrobiales bacterium]|nr:glycosyltransferase family 4 protein [Acidimicrobiales bacterium]